jgi:hypothetical protein
MRILFVMNSSWSDFLHQVTGGGKVAQIYAIRQAIAKSIVAYAPTLHYMHTHIFVCVLLVVFVDCCDVVMPRCWSHLNISYNQKFVDEVSKREIKVRPDSASVPRF